MDVITSQIRVINWADLLVINRFLSRSTALGHCEILHFLLESLEDSSDINVQDNIHATPAHDAAEYGQTEAMVLLLRHGANVNIKDTVCGKILRYISRVDLGVSMG